MESRAALMDSIRIIALRRVSSTLYLTLRATLVTVTLS